MAVLLVSSLASAQAKGILYDDFPAHNRWSGGWEDLYAPACTITDGVAKVTAAAPAGERATAAPGQLVVDPEHRRWLKRKGGRPFFMCGPGDPEDFLYQGKLNPDGTRDGDQMTLIEKLRGTGANCIYIQAVRSHGGDGNPTHNPFVDNDPDKGINEAVLDQWEAWFTEMDRNGIVITLFLYDDRARVWNTGDAVGPNEQEFIRALVSRFKHHNHLIWCVAEEYQEALSAQRVRSIAKAIRDAGDAAHPIAVHKLAGLSFTEFADDPNINMFAMQYGGSARRLHDGVVAAWREANGRYVLNMSEAHGHGTGATARRKNWACAMGGASVMIYQMDIASTPTADLEDCGRLVRFFEATNYYEMAPHDELALDGTEYVLARPGHSYIAYTSRADVPIGLRDMSAGAYLLRWSDCETGKRVRQPTVRVAGGNVRWSRPEGIGEEAALYIRRLVDPRAVA